MYALLNAYNKSHLVQEIKHGDHVVNFNLSILLKKRNRAELDPPNQYALLNEYVDYKGKEFKDKLMILYMNADVRLLNTITEPEIYPLPVSIVYEVLDMFDYNDVLDWIIHVRKIQPLANLADKFDDQDTGVTEFTRAQTYLKSEYLELAALTIIIKSVIGIIAHFGYLKQSEIASDYREDILYNFLVGHKVASLPPTVRLSSFVEKLVSISLKETSITSVRIIEKRLPKEYTAEFVLAAVMLQKISIATIINDNPSKHIITGIYTFINNRLSIKGDTSNSIRSKDGYIDAEVGEKESIIESYWMTTAVPPNKPIELNNSVATVDKIIYALGEVLDKSIIEDAKLFMKFILDGNVTPEQISIIRIIYKNSVIDPRGIDHLNIDSIYNLMVVAFAWLWKYDFKYLAILLASITEPMDDDVMGINITVNRTKLPNELRDVLRIYFPYERVIREGVTANLAEENIDDICVGIYGKVWRHMCDSSYLEQIKDINNGLPSDLKVTLVKLSILIEELNGGNNG